MKLKAIACVLAFSFALSTHAEPVSYTVDSKHTFPSFEVSHVEFSTQRGRFNNTVGKIALDRAAKTGSIDITIDARSIDTGLDKLEEHLRAEDFFNVAKHPTLTFKSNKIKFKGNIPTTAYGDFTLLGVSRPIKLTITHFKCGQHPVTQKFLCGADAQTVIRRSDYGMTYGLPAVGDEVKILIQIEAVEDNPKN